MSRVRFHHPDFSFPVARRQLGVELLDLAEGMAEALLTRGRSLSWNESYPSRKGYNDAVYRLRKKGLIAYRRSGGRNPVMMLTADGRKRLPEELKPEKWWNKKWNGLWYVLAYDVPESERSYRASLRGFLKRLRMGKLQGSVYVTWRDIRPEFHDLVEAGAVNNYAFLFESRTVLGLPAREIVHASWNMDRLDTMQRWYCEVCERNLEAITGNGMAASDLGALAREEFNAYFRIMKDDPLLPRKLWPVRYQGSRAYKLHRRLQQAIARRL
jgi:DNA-binding transcriptional regulator PaaX